MTSPAKRPNRPALIYRGADGKEVEVTRVALRGVWAKADWQERADLLHHAFSLTVGPVVVALAVALLLLGEGVRALLLLAAGLVLTVAALALLALDTVRRARDRRQAQRNQAERHQEGQG